MSSARPLNLKELVRAHNLESGNAGEGRDEFVGKAIRKKIVGIVPQVGEWQHNDTSRKGRFGQVIYTCEFGDIASGETSFRDSFAPAVS